jgi:asparagine synthase (glutamine-hydrolysing)
MCGICGIFDFQGAPVDRDLLQRMTDRLEHRGPDGQGHFVCSNVGLGNRRLSIIDLEGGWQPQTNEDGKIQVVFNGEIYNFIELRNELIQKGHKFKTRSDTEVIAHAYEEWGDDCLRRFNGIFSFALWNASRRTLLLARDHLGVKPLYYVLLGNRLLFASEIKSLLVDAKCPREVDIQALGQLFTLRYVPSPATIFKGIRKLPPAHKMIIDATGVKIERFWTWTPHIRTTIDERELIEQYQALVEDAVRLQMRSDVPVGLFLSSGIDSGALLAIMSKVSTQPIRTFTIGFEEGAESNETKDALDLAKMFESDHSEMMIGPQDYEKYYARYLWDIEEPVGNETAAAFYFVSLITSRRVKVALTGQGADEPWGGYNRYLGVKFSELYSRLPEVLTRGLLSKFGDRWVRQEQWKRGLTSLYEKNVLTRLVNIYSFFSAAMKNKLFKPWIKEIISSNGVEAERALQYWQSDVKDLDALTQALYMDTRTNLPDDLLMVGDKTSMANSLELRVPFLDYRLVEFIETLPGDLKIRGLTGKYLHKKAVEKWLPKEVVYRKKKGFANPINKWLRTCMRSFVNEHLLSEKAAVNYYFNRDFIRETIEKNERHQQNYMRHIYLLLSFELWHRQFISA